MLRRLFARFRPDHSLGARGEAAVARHVRKELGYRVIARNVRYTDGELDIVALAGDVLVFIEVRTRTSEEFGTPEHSIRRNKRERVRKAARRFIKARRLQQLTPRFDAAAVVWPEGGQVEIRYHQNAFAMSGH